MSKEYTPLVIAKSFTKQYYEIMHKKPQQLYRFYKDESNFFHGDENQSTETISGSDNIREKVEQLNLAGAVVDLTSGSVDAQRSDNNAVFLVVTGKFTIPGKTARPFIQSFFLVCQNASSESQPSYYVRNSVFRLFGEEVFTPLGSVQEPFVVTPPPVFEKEVEKVVKVEPVPVIEEPQQISSEEDDHGNKSHDEVVDNQSLDQVDDATDISEPDYVHISGKNEVVESVNVVSESTITPPVIEEPVPEPVVVKKVKPSSWAALVGGGQTSAPEPEKETPKPKKTQAPKKETETAKETTAVVSKPVEKVGPPLTVYIAQLPQTVVEADIRSLFESFGEIKKIDVYAQKGFAFVDFTDPSSVKNAMAKKGSGYFVIRDTPIQIEERHTKGITVNKNGNNANRTGKGGNGNVGVNRQNNKGGNDKNAGAKTDNKAGAGNKQQS